MPADYKNRPRERPPRKSPGWAWLAVGLLIGLFVAFLVYLREHQPPAPVAVLSPPAKPVSQPRAPAPRKSPREKTPPPKPRFEFYTILPEMEVPVPDSALPSRGAKPAAGPEEPGTYLLQVGSFRAIEEADRLKAQLALLGLEAQVQTVAVDGKDTWHRVRLGPFTNLSKVNQIRERLREHDLDAIVLKIKT